MKNIDLTKLTKVELINGIINLTTKYNECIRSRGYLNTHKVPSANTLRTKSRESLEEGFERAWDWLREEIRAYYNVLDVDVDKQAIDNLKTRLQKETDQNYNEFDAIIENSMAKISEIIRNYATESGIFNIFSDITEDDIIITNISDECICIKLKNCFGGEINYYHRRDLLSSLHGDTSKLRDEINFGTIGAFDLDSLRGHQQLFQMNLMSHIGRNNEIRSKMNAVLDSIRNRNLARIRMDSRINSKMVAGIDEIVAPYINSIAMGEFLWKPSKTK